MNPNGTVEIWLGNADQTALLDHEDYALVSSYHWYLDSRGYASAHVPKRRTKVQMHRIIMGLPKFVAGGQCVDHINGSKVDNRRCNLRLCDRSQNRMNAPRKRDGSSQYKGVRWAPDRGKWLAQIQHKGLKYYIGSFHCEEHAARAYDARASEIFGQFARLNFGSV